MTDFLTQDQIFENIRCKTLVNDQITASLTELYDQKLIGSRYFYHQDLNGVPLGKILQEGSRHAYCKMTETIIFDGQCWDRAPGIPGTIWPPTCLDDLIGSPELSEHCICDAGIEGCDCDYEFVLAQLKEYWIEHILLQPVPRCGYGAFARMRIKAHSRIAEYTGTIVAQDSEVCGKGRNYRAKISIRGQDGIHHAAEIDASSVGSIARFLNHSCEPNCKLWEGRCGRERRILYIRALRNIKRGEELTLDYGPDWFVTSNELCHCGAGNCRNASLREGRRSNNKACAEEIGYRPRKI
jgi:hypothetical protein